MVYFNVSRVELDQQEWFLSPKAMSFSSRALLASNPSSCRYWQKRTNLSMVFGEDASTTV